MSSLKLLNNRINIKMKLTKCWRFPFVNDTGNNPFLPKRCRGTKYIRVFDSFLMIPSLPTPFVSWALLLPIYLYIYLPF